MRGLRFFCLSQSPLVLLFMDQPTLAERTGNSSVSSVDRSKRLDAWSMSKPSTLLAAPRSTFSPSETSHVSAPGPALSST